MADNFWGWAMRGTRIPGLRTVLVAIAAAVALSGILAAGAGAVVVRGANGQVFGITPQAGVNPASIPGSVAKPRNGANIFSANGNLDYHLGPVLHSSAPYLIFWDPSGHISAASRALFTRYFTDVAASSTQGTNVYGVNRQFTDSTGFADYSQSFNPATQAINDTHPYPTQDAVNCTRTDATFFPTCVTDAQMQSEVARLITADGLPTGIGANAPIYFVVTPTDVNVCQDSTHCADNVFCAYHSEFTDGSSPVLYSPVALLILGSEKNPKACQSDGNTAVQEPNADSADVAIKFMSHEDNETITDPVHGTGWWDNATGQESGDNCNFNGAFDPANGSNPSAFTPTLGGTEAAGTLFNQAINGNHYYTQSEWSNGDVDCKMQPTASAINASFTAPASALRNAAVSFNPSASTSAGGYTSVTWNFGDFSAPAFAATSSAPTAVSHIYGSPGTYTVTLKLVDSFGNLSTVSRNVTVGSSPSASFTASPGATTRGRAVAFNSTASSDPDAGVSITSYSWNFGDGSTGSGATTSHAYSALGTYTVTLTVTNSIGLTATTTRQVAVDVPPTAVFGVPNSAVAGTPVAFSGSQSSTRQGSIASYSWNFGDHHSGSGRAPKHSYSRAGHYTVTLTVLDSAGLTATVSHQITVLPSPISRLAVTRNSKGTFIQVSVTGAGVLSVGSSRSRVRRAGKISFKISLSRSGLAALHKHHKLTVKVKVKFVTRAGVTSIKTISVTFRG